MTAIQTKPTIKVGTRGNSLSSLGFAQSLDCAREPAQPNLRLQLNYGSTQPTIGYQNDRMDFGMNTAPYHFTSGLEAGMSKEDAIKSAIEILKNAGIDAKMVRIYGSTTEAIIVLPEMKFPQPTHPKTPSSKPLISISA